LRDSGEARRLGPGEQALDRVDDVLALRTTGEHVDNQGAAHVSGRSDLIVSDSAFLELPLELG
jgi:hypothetical protein